MNDNFNLVTDAVYLSQQLLIDAIIVHHTSVAFACFTYLHNF